MSTVASVKPVGSKAAGSKGVSAKPHAAKRHRDIKQYNEIDQHYPFGCFARQNFKRGATARMCTRAGVRCVSRGVHDVQSAIYQALVGAIVRPAVLVARLGDRSTLKMRDIEYGIEHSRRAPRSLLYAIPYAEHRLAEEASRIAQDSAKQTNKNEWGSSQGRPKVASAHGGASSLPVKRVVDASIETTSASSSAGGRLSGGDDEAENEHNADEAEQDKNSEEEQEPEDAAMETA